jgi:hypothetical protein
MENTPVDDTVEEAEKSRYNFWWPSYRKSVVELDRILVYGRDLGGAMFGFDVEIMYLSKFVHINSRHQRVFFAHRAAAYSVLVDLFYLLDATVILKAD